MKEQWKNVPNYEGRYLASNNGRLISVINGKQKLLKGSISRDGYKQYTLNHAAKGLYNVYGGHQLVAMCFLDHKPNSTSGLVVDHINNIKTDNRLINLQLLSNHNNTTKDYDIINLFGVSKYSDKYKASVYYKGKNIYLGMFLTQIEAYNTVVKYLKDNNIKRVYNQTKKL